MTCPLPGGIAITRDWSLSPRMRASSLSALPGITALIGRETGVERAAFLTDKRNPSAAASVIKLSSTLINTPVRIVNQPFKLGWQDGQLWVEVHPALQEDSVEPPTLTDLTRLVVEATRESLTPVDWTRVQRAFAESRGTPVEVSLSPATVAADR